MNVLITGINGFVGKNLVEALKDQYTIYGIDILDTPQEDIVQTFSWDDLEKGCLPDVDIVIHLAGKAHDTKGKTNRQEYFEVNTTLTQKIYDHFITSGAKKFIFFSSVKAAADSVEGDILTEEVIPQPKGPYGESKIKAEEYILNNLTEKKHSYIIRPCMIHGPGNKGNLNLLYNVISKRVPWPLGAFNNQRSFASIDNVCFIVTGLLQKNAPSGIYHIADDDTLSTNQLIEVICHAMGKKSNILNIPKRVMRACAGIGDVLKLPLNTERLVKLTENYVVSNQKIKKTLGIEKLPVKSYDGFKKTIKSFINDKDQ